MSKSICSFCGEVHEEFAGMRVTQCSHVPKDFAFVLTPPRLNEKMSGDGASVKEVPVDMVISNMKPWDYVLVTQFDRTMPIEMLGQSRFYHHLMQNLEIVWETKDGVLYFDYPETEWHPFTEAIDQLKALLDQWHAWGGVWNEAADIVEKYDEGELIYSVLGKSEEKLVPHRISLKVCKFFYQSYATALNGMASLLSEATAYSTMPALTEVVGLREDQSISSALASHVCNYRCIGNDMHYVGDEPKVNSRGTDLRTMVSPNPSPNASFADETEEEIIDERLARGDWFCTGHVPPFLNDAESEVCEVGCGAVKPRKQ